MNSTLYIFYVILQSYEYFYILNQVGLNLTAKKQLKNIMIGIIIINDINLHRICNFKELLNT